MRDPIVPAMTENVPKDITMTSETEETVLDLKHRMEQRADSGLISDYDEKLYRRALAALSRAPVAEDPVAWIDAFTLLELQMPASQRRECSVWRVPEKPSGEKLHALYLHPSPEMGEISREELARIIDPKAWENRLVKLAEAGEWAIKGTRPGEEDHWSDHTRSFMSGHRREEAEKAVADSLAKADAILSKLKENGLSREELGGLARSQPGSDAQERSPVPPLSDGERG